MKPYYNNPNVVDQMVREIMNERYRAKIELETKTIGRFLVWAGSMVIVFALLALAFCVLGN